MHSFRGVLVAPILCCLSLIAFGQAPAGEIRVEVKDPSGAAVEASGRLVGPGLDRTFQTDAVGIYSFSGLPFGRYRLEVSKGGFATQSVTIDVLSATPVTRTVTMTLTGTATRIDVIETTPLAGVELPRDEIPAPVQTATQLDLQNSAALDLADFMNRRLDGVNVNENQGNPFQPDVNYRGYTASPLLGTPQGLSVYMDGVRMNQPFGDVVSWDLIPRVAIGEMTLMPGSNPVFGLNTLGGALSIQTKSGVSNPGTSVQIGYGSYDRKTLEIEHGGSYKGFNWYLAGNGFTEHGWREDSPSDVHQLFAKLGWQNSNTALSLTAAYANNTLFGNGLQEQRLLASDYASVYTLPDTTTNRSPFLNLSARHSVNRSLVLSGNVYYRYILTNTFNGDLNADSLDESVYQPSAADRTALTAAGYTGFPVSGATAANTPFPFWRCIAQALEKDEPDEKCDGLLTRTRTNQHNYGVSGQATWTGPGVGSGGGHNQFTVGAGWDGSSVGFTQASQFGYLNPDRSITPVNAFADGSTNVNGAPFDTRASLHGNPKTGSVYATDTLSAGRAWNFTLSGRYNRTTIDNLDRLIPSGTGSLSSHNVFDRFNPAAGVTYNPSHLLNAYFGYSEGSRAPTSIELGCADPTLPCKLPNALAGDPPLNQVVTRTFEAGVRGGLERSLNWSIGWFRAENHDDILFVSSPQTGFGYFKNFGETRRQGVEVDLHTHIWRVTLGGGYTFLDATYQSTETVDGSSNSTNDSVSVSRGLDGNIQIQPGDRIPLIPQNLVKAYADIQATAKFTIDLGMTAVTSSYARGNENNLSQPDGIYYLGPGVSPGYEIFNAGARYQVQKRLQLFIDVNNLGDRRYYTAAQLGPTGFTATGTFIARPLSPVGGDYPVVHATFYAPGAPRTATGGLRFTF